ncbi:MAG: ATP-dependent DNA ligase [Ilumatobacteraceae bacterium]
MQFAALADASRRLAATSKRGEKSALLSDVLRRAAPDEIAVAVGLLTGAPRQGRIGVGWATLRDVRVEPAHEPTLDVLDIDRMLDRLASMSGSGVNAARRALLADVFARATEPEQDLLWKVLGGELRQGALDGVMADAVARAAAVPIAAVRRAHMLSGDLGVTARAAMTGGQDALAAVSMVPGRAVQPMLASPAETVAAALQGTGPASVEWKLDGARIQAHRRDGEVRLYTRNLNDITDRLGSVAALVRGLPGGDLVLDGEVLGVDADGAPRRFQDTMGDFGADGPTGRGRGLSAYYFDVLHAGGATVVDEPRVVRRDILATIVPASARLPSMVTGDPDEAAAFLHRAVDAGHEGVMVKSLGSPYDAGRRGGAWRKIKPVHTLELVVLAAEWGHGRRTGWLSNLHLGARGDPGTFVMVGKTFKGLTDDLLRWQTDALQSIAVGTEDGYVVHVRPELVVEIALDGVQVSTRYPGGVALRFARVRRYRPDKSVADADHIATVQAMLR